MLDDNLDKTIEKAVNLVNACNWEAASCYIDQAVMRYGSDAQLWSMLALARLRLHKYDAAVDAGLRAVALNPLDWQAHLILGISFLDLEDFAGGLTHFDVSLAHHPENAYALFFRGIALLELGRLIEALESVESSLRCDVELADGHRVRALILAKMNRMSEAEGALQRAFELEPLDRYSFCYAGEVKLVAGDARAAQELFEHAVSLDPRCHQAFEGLGLSLAAQGCHGEARTAMSEALKLNSRLRRAREYMAGLG